MGYGNILWCEGWGHCGAVTGQTEPKANHAMKGAGDKACLKGEYVFAVLEMVSHAPRL
jgi:hypothetical protein